MAKELKVGSKVKIVDGGSFPVNPEFLGHIGYVVDISEVDGFSVLLGVPLYFRATMCSNLEVLKEPKTTECHGLATKTMDTYIIRWTDRTITHVAATGIMRAAKVAEQMAKDKNKRVDSIEIAQSIIVVED